MRRDDPTPTLGPLKITCCQHVLNQGNDAVEQLRSAETVTASNPHLPLRSPRSPSISL